MSSTSSSETEEAGEAGGWRAFVMMRNQQRSPTPVPSTSSVNSGDPVSSSTPTIPAGVRKPKLIVPGVERKAVQRILEQVVKDEATVHWDDVPCQEKAKHTLNMMVVWPAFMPQFFLGSRRPDNRILLYGPPGNSSLLARCTAAGRTLISISGETVSRWFGYRQNMFRALFRVARRLQPSVIFLNDVDFLLGARTAGEHLQTQRLKAAILAELDGLPASGADNVFVIAAIHRLQDVDEAALSRFPRREYVGPPDGSSDSDPAAAAPDP